MTATTFQNGYRTSNANQVHAARKADPIPSERLTPMADMVVHFAMALLPFSAIAWTFVAH